MTTKKINQEQESNEQDYLEWMNLKTSIPDLLEIHAKKVSSANKIWREKIEENNPSLLRKQISETFSVTPDVSILESKAEKQYRDMQKAAAKAVPVIFKSDSRKLWLDGECSNFRYQRDIFASIHQGLKDKLSAQKSILASLIQEMKDQGIDSVF